MESVDCGCPAGADGVVVEHESDCAFAPTGSIATTITDPDEKAKHDALTAGQINALSARIGNWAERKGFHEPVQHAALLEILANRLDDHGIGKVSFSIDDDPTNLDRTISDFLKFVAAEHRTLHLGMKIALVHSELSEALETLRVTGADNLRDGNMPEEIDDAIIRLLDLAAIIKHPTGDGVIDKMKVNEDRPYKHGKVA